MQPVLAGPGRENWHPVVDPVCGRQVEPVPIAYHVAYADDDYYFCSTACADRFRKDPASYLQRQALTLSLRPAGG